MSVRERVPLRELLVALETGSRPKGGVKGIESGVPSLGGEHLDANGGFKLERVRYVPCEFAASMRRGRIAVGDVLVVKDGATTGKVSLVRDSFPYKDAVVNEHVFLCRCDERVDPRYVFWYLFSAQGQREILSDFRGAAQGGISQKFADLVQIPFRPRDEQHRIVAEIEKQFSRLDEAVANLKRVKANLRRQRAATLRAAVEGALLGDVRRTGWIDVTIGEVAQVISGLTKNPKREALPRKLPYLRVANVYANDLRLDQIEYIGVADQELDKLLLRPGDLLVVEGNGSLDQIGRVALWDGSIENCVHQNHLIKVRFGSRVTPQWALTWLLSPGGRHEIERVSSSTSGLHTLSTGKVARLPIPIPPVAEQQRIVAEVDRCLSIVREVEAEVEANLLRAQALRHSVLSKAFGDATAMRRHMWRD